MENNINNNEVQKVSKIKQIFRKFYPTYKYKSVENIPYSLIEKNNIKLIMLDMDNTIINFDEKKYSKEMKEWAIRMRRNGIKLYILSNSPFGNLVKKVADELGMKYCYNAGKPLLKGFNKIMQIENIEKEYMLMVGDQIFTDILGGNRFGIKTVLVNPIDKKERIHTKFKRPFERIVLKRYSRKKGENK